MFQPKTNMAADVLASRGTVMNMAQTYHLISPCIAETIINEMQ